MTTPKTPNKQTQKKKRTKRIAYSRPERGDAARDLGLEQRRKYHRRMMTVSAKCFQPSQLFCAEHKALNPKPTANMRRSGWTATSLRGELLAVLDVLRERYLVNTGMELSRSDLLSAFVAEGLPSLIVEDEFKEPRKTKPTTTTTNDEINNVKTTNLLKGI